jgi:hypothetical protein
MKKLILLTVLGTALLATPCYAQARMRISPYEYEKETSPNITVVDCKGPTVYVAVYKVPVVCPYGYAMWDLSIKKYTSCKTSDDLFADIDNRTYEEVKDNDDLMNIELFCSKV